MMLEPLLSAAHFPSLPLLLFFFFPLFYFNPRLLFGAFLELFADCWFTVFSLSLSLALTLSFFLPLPFFFFFRWWECLLLGDGARGEPNIFPLLALPGEADLEQHWTPGFFHITRVFSLALVLSLSPIF